MSETGRRAAGGLRWIACELHSHTLHSDGRLEVAGLSRYGAGRGLDLVALTDHNTISGIAEIPSIPEEGARILPGMELTSFHGHILALGIREYVEWRHLTRRNARTAADAIHALGGVVGAAHPFRPGNPFCTGCYWEFEDLDWACVDYIEAWSEPDPHLESRNARAIALWEGILDGGGRMAATAGRDYHGGPPRGLEAATFLGAEPGRADLASSAVEALRRGRVSVSIGPRLDLELAGAGGGPAFVPGDEVPAGGRPLRARASVDLASRRERWAADVAPLRAAFRWKGGSVEAELRPEGDGELVAAIELPASASTWLRAELVGEARGVETVVAFTSPLYLA